MKKNTNMLNSYIGSKKVLGLYKDKTPLQAIFKGEHFLFKNYEIVKSTAYNGDATQLFIPDVSINDKFDESNEIKMYKNSFMKLGKWYIRNSENNFEEFGGDIKSYGTLEDLRKAPYYEGKLSDVGFVRYEYRNGNWNEFDKIWLKVDEGASDKVYYTKTNSIEKDKVWNICDANGDSVFDSAQIHLQGDMRGGSVYTSWKYAKLVLTAQFEADYTFIFNVNDQYLSINDDKIITGKSDTGGLVSKAAGAGKFSLEVETTGTLISGELGKDDSKSLRNIEVHLTPNQSVIFIVGTNACPDAYQYLFAYVSCNGKNINGMKDWKNSEFGVVKGAPYEYYDGCCLFPSKYYEGYIITGLSNITNSTYASYPILTGNMIFTCHDNHKKIKSCEISTQSISGSTSGKPEFSNIKLYDYGVSFSVSKGTLKLLQGDPTYSQKISFGGVYLIFNITFIDGSKRTCQRTTLFNPSYI